MNSTYYYRNKDKLIKSSLDYYYENKETILLKDRIYFKTYYAQNKKALLASVKLRLESKLKYFFIVGLKNSGASSSSADFRSHSPVLRPCSILVNIQLPKILQPRNIAIIKKI